jgi:hypothetical protein
MTEDETSHDPTSLIRLGVIRIILANSFDDVEIVRCLDTYTGKPCDVVFIPAKDPNEDGEDSVFMMPTFPLPEQEVEAQLDRYIPLDTLPKTNQTDYKNN